MAGIAWAVLAFLILRDWDKRECRRIEANDLRSNLRHPVFNDIATAIVYLLRSFSQTLFLQNLMLQHLLSGDDLQVICSLR